MRNKKALQNLKADRRQKLVSDAVNIAIADATHKQLLHAVFNRLFRTRYFKQWSDHKFYHISHGHYVILLTDAFLKTTMLNGGFDDLNFFQICKQEIANEDKYVELMESDFDMSYDKAHMNNILAGML